MSSLLNFRSGALFQIVNCKHFVTDALSLLLFSAASVLMFATVSDYGLTYDEPAHVDLGNRILDFYADGFHVSRRLGHSAYGGGFDLPAALLRRISPWDAYRTNHWLCVVVALLGLLGTLRVGRLVAGSLGGLLSLMLLLSVPVYYGHQFNNPKDIPFAAGYIWGLYFIARTISDPERVFDGTLRGARSLLVSLSISLGLGMSVRVGGAILIAYLLLFLALHFLDRWRVTGKRIGLPLKWISKLGAVLLGSWALMAVFWPRALKEPVQGPADALETATRYTAYDSPTWLLGREFSSNHLPWNYLPTYFAVQLPELLSAGFLLTSVALVVTVVGCLRKRRELPLQVLLLAAATWLPPMYAVLRGATLYNGLRHFLFIIPPLCVLTAWGATRLVHFAFASKKARSTPGALSIVADRAGWLLLLPLTAYCADQFQALWRLHPYQHVFFNRASGGVARGVSDFESEYYGAVYQELLSKLKERLWRENPEVYLNSVFRVAGCGLNRFFTYNLPLNFQYLAVRQAKDADIFATYLRDDCLRHFKNRPELVRVERDAALLAVARVVNADKLGQTEPVLPADQQLQQEQAEEP